MTTHATHLDEIKDQGIILSRKLIREDDVLIHVLSRHFGQLLLYAHHGAISKRRFPNSCEILRHVQFYAKKSHNDFWTLQEITTLNYFKELSQQYGRYVIATRALSLIKKMVPLEYPSERLYILLGGFLQFLTQTPTPELTWVAFEIKVVQEAGLFSLNLVQKAISEHRLRLSGEEITRVQMFLNSKNQHWIFSRPKEEMAVLQKLEVLMRRIREDYNLLPRGLMNLKVTGMTPPLEKIQ